MQRAPSLVMLCATTNAGGTMLRTLLESQAVRSRRAGGTLVSVGVHTTAIALAIAATARATSAPRPVVVTPPPVTWLKPVTADPAPAPTHPIDGLVFLVLRPLGPIPELP